ncbi:fimbrial protein [Aeromonas sp. CA23]|uniref:fimbria/pilus periplasmic chaperone n=1 Tax=Aeromonas sp. CA23 TaxID=2033032 RepID=UPI000BFCC1D4|nr:fimbria/pilus periplasmic chaperone [Aeromonas sp. CA23]ATL98235.1 fimbrial protein [Aeromonas sp. CA23]
MKLMINAVVAMLFFMALPGQAAVALDRTRVIYAGDNKSQSLNIRNNNKTLPYLAQAWLEDAQGNKVSGPFVVLPPVQRLEPGAESMLKVQATGAVRLLPQDKESLFYFNLREIPPRSDKPNSLQLALQTRIKFFYRPQHLVIPSDSHQTPWQQQVQMTPKGGRYHLHNPTPYFITLVDGVPATASAGASEFTPVMLAPYGDAELNLSVQQLGLHPRLTYVNDFGGRQQLQFHCGASSCQFKPDQAQQ